MFLKHSLKLNYIKAARIRAINTIANNINTSFQVFLIHSIYGMFKYERPKTNIALVGATNIVTP